jgi:hypothetical protein
MNTNNLNEIIKNKQEAIELLPSPYRKLTDDVLDEENVKLSISTLKDIYKDKGGIHLLEVEDYQILVRVPNETHLNHGMENKKRTAIEADRWLVGECLLYPSVDVFKSWLISAPGLGTPFAKKLLELGATTQEAKAKKL